MKLIGHSDCRRSLYENFHEDEHGEKYAQAYRC
jgi:hypothetical protein